MAKANPFLIEVLRKTASRLENGSNYQWGHMGSCNCGHLAQEITNYSKSEIHSFAMQRYGDWSKQILDYCPDSNMPIDHLITIMLEAGLSKDDIKNLEKLTDREILILLPEEERILRYNNRIDVVKYLKTWARQLENELLNEVDLDDLVGVDTPGKQSRKFEYY